MVVVVDAAGFVGLLGFAVVVVKVTRWYFSA